MNRLGGMGLDVKEVGGLQVNVAVLLPGPRASGVDLPASDSTRARESSWSVAADPSSRGFFYFPPAQTADSSTVHYLAGGGHDNAPGETLDALELLARVLAHIPDPMRVVSFITQPGLIRRILDHLAHRAEEGRAPPPSQLVQT